MVCCLLPYQHVVGSFERTILGSAVLSIPNWLGYKVIFAEACSALLASALAIFDWGLGMHSFWNGTCEHIVMGCCAPLPPPLLHWKAAWLGLRVFGEM